MTRFRQVHDKVVTWYPAAHHIVFRVCRSQDATGLRTIRELQRGASGVIVLAEESCGGGGSTPVAVKLMPRAKAASPALQREMLTQRSCLMHPHVIQVRCISLAFEGGAVNIRCWRPRGGE